ncbi:DUF6623 family protein [Clostridium ganghwense]|uniref:Uncharacterized protein n=1 Tax=Clostridium ganghwense TaxID=312089 RepID=A0ABT4CQV4_9CLOT|nr:DUF6623 family protein [Clostridium ganghwense]MCY6371436.1 hypothetical protein [Clostridium ganghwense]
MYSDMWRDMVELWRPNKMVLAHAMWTHGHSIQIEYPERIASIKRAGFYAQIKGKPGTRNWFHFAIPTPVIVNSKRLQVGSVLIRFKTGSTDTSINSVHIYDGERKIASFDNLDLSPRQFETRRFKIPGNPKIKFGLGISIGVGFGVESMSHSMEFSSAGCDFLDTFIVYPKLE